MFQMYDFIYFKQLYKCQRYIRCIFWNPIEGRDENAGGLADQVLNGLGHEEAGGDTTRTTKG